MPVMVTGVDDAMGAASARALLATGGEVRVWVDGEVGDAASWRASGAKVARGEATDEGRLEAALEQVHTVVHCAGGPMEDPAAGTEHLATVVSAALGAGVRRLVWVTDLAAGPPRPPPSAVGAGDPARAGGRYVEALTVRRALVASLPIDVVVLRTGMRWGPDDRFTRWLAARGSTVASRSVHAPVWIGDVAAAVRAADAQRGSGAAVVVDVQIVGPQRSSPAALAQRLARAGPGPVPADAPVPADEAAVLDWLAVDAPGDPDALGRDGTDIGAGLAALAGRRPPWRSDDRRTR